MSWITSRGCSVSGILLSVSEASPQALNISVSASLSFQSGVAHSHRRSGWKEKMSALFDTSTGTPTEDGLPLVAVGSLLAFIRLIPIGITPGWSHSRILSSSQIRGGPPMGNGLPLKELSEKVHAKFMSLMPMARTNGRCQKRFPGHQCGWAGGRRMEKRFYIRSLSRPVHTGERGNLLWSSQNSTRGSVR